MAKKAATQSQYNVPVIKEGQKVKWVILREIENWILVNCENGAFTGVILAKEAKELKRSNVELSSGTELELEIINPAIRHEDGYYIVSVTRLLQYDVWKSIIEKFEKDTIITVVPTEANLWGLLIDMHGIKGFIPLSQLAPIHYPRVEDGDQDAIFDKLLALIGEEIKVRVINIDEEEQAFIGDLDIDEIEILACFMKCEWLNRVLLTWENVKPFYVERDFSQANLIDKYTKLLKEERS